VVGPVTGPIWVTRAFSIQEYNPDASPVPGSTATGARSGAGLAQSIAPGSGLREKEGTGLFACYASPQPGEPVCWLAKYVTTDGREIATVDELLFPKGKKRKIANGDDDKTAAK
jgi:hypothetical protein